MLGNQTALIDGKGNRTKRIAGNGAFTDYDLRNRLDFVRYQSNHTRDYIYDAAGQLLSVIEPCPIRNLHSTIIILLAPSPIINLQS